MRAEKTIQLKKNFETPLVRIETPSSEIAGGFVNNLGEVVEDLLASSFKGDIALHHRKIDSYYKRYLGIPPLDFTYSFFYGSFQKNNVLKTVHEDGKARNLKQLRTHIRKAEKLENPNFAIGGKNNLLTLVEINRKDSPTRIVVQVDYNETIIQFSYEVNSPKRELDQMNKSINGLVKRGYEKREGMMIVYSPN